MNRPVRLAAIQDRRAGVEVTTMRLLVKRLSAWAAPLLLFAAANAASAPARAPARRTPPPSPGGVRAFRAVPVWYLNYELQVDASSEDASGYGDRLHSIVTGSAQINLPNLGASIDDALNPSTSVEPLAEMLAAMEDKATWIQYDRALDREMTEAESRARMLFWVDSTAALGALTFTSKEEESHKDMAGTGPVAPYTAYHFSVDVGKKVYTLAFPYVFTETPSFLQGVKGTLTRLVTENDGSTHWVTDPVTQGFSEFFTSSWTLNPQPVDVGRVYLVHGTLPDSLAPLSGTASFAIKRWRGSMKGTLVMRYTLSPTPPEDVELIVKPIADPVPYADWEPVGGGDESTPGSRMAVEVELRRKGGGAPKTKANQFVYRLLNTSREKGVCMNWPAQPVDPPALDLEFDEDPANAYRITDGPQRQVAKESGTDLTKGTIVINCFDYGAHGALQAVAELNDGRQLVGVVEGTRDERSLKLPHRDPSSIIASNYMKGVGAKSDDADDENDPVGDGFLGDGLTLYEEYRGFMVDGAFTRGDWKKKDLFVRNEMGREADVEAGVAIYRMATGIVVSAKLNQDEIGPDYVINRNRTDGPHVVDQHAIHIVAGPAGAKWAETGDGSPGTPGISGRIEIPIDWKMTATRHIGNPVTGHDVTVPQFPITLAHEMLHASNVYHHGRGDNPDAKWNLVSGAPKHVEEDGVPITMMEEDGTPTPFDWLFRARSSIAMYVGVASGQHSGDTSCLMRYYIADAYVSIADRSIRYPIDDEAPGDKLCTSPAGTGANAPGNTPQSRYGSASGPNTTTGVLKQRGDCLHQLRVSDRDTAPKR